MGVGSPVPLRQKFSGQVIDLCAVHVCVRINSGELRVCFIPAQPHSRLVYELTAFGEVQRKIKCQQVRLVCLSGDEQLQYRPGVNERLMRLRKENN